MTKPPQMRRRAQVYAAGREAARRGVLATANPHNKLSTLFIDWSDGHLAGRMEEPKMPGVPEHRRRQAFAAGRNAALKGKPDDANDREHGTIYYDDWADGHATGLGERKR